MEAICAELQGAEQGPSATCLVECLRLCAERVVALVFRFQGGRAGRCPTRSAREMRAAAVADALCCQALGRSMQLREAAEARKASAGGATRTRTLSWRAPWRSSARFWAPPTWRPASARRAVAARGRGAARPGADGRAGDPLHPGGARRAGQRRGLGSRSGGRLYGGRQVRRLARARVADVGLHRPGPRTGAAQPRWSPPGPGPHAGGPGAWRRVGAGGAARCARACAPRPPAAPGRRRCAMPAPPSAARVAAQLVEESARRRPTASLLRAGWPRLGSPDRSRCCSPSSPWTWSRTLAARFIELLARFVAESEPGVRAAGGRPPAGLLRAGRRPRITE